MRESNREDQLLENEKKFLETQQQKLNEIVKSLHNLFSNKKEEKKTYGEMSTIFGSLGNFFPFLTTYLKYFLYML